MTTSQWTVEYLDIDVANKTMHVRIKDAEGKMHEDKELPWSSYVARRILTTLFAEYMDAEGKAEEGTFMHEDFAEQFAVTLPLID